MIAPFDNLGVMEEAVSIIRGEHSGWKGDRIENAEHFVYLIARDMPEDAGRLADDLSNNASDFSDELGISPDRVRWFASRFRDAIKATGGSL